MQPPAGPPPPASEPPAHHDPIAAFIASLRDARGFTHPTTASHGWVPGRGRGEADFLAWVADQAAITWDHWERFTDNAPWLVIVAETTDRCRLWEQAPWETVDDVARRVRAELAPRTAPWLFGMAPSGLLRRRPRWEHWARGTAPDGPWPLTWYAEARGAEAAAVVHGGGHHARGGPPELWLARSSAPVGLRDLLRGHPARRAHRLGSV